MKGKPINAVRVSKLVVIRPGDKIRARGGPVFNGARIGYPGVYLIQSLFQKGKRVFANATAIDKKHGAASGSYVLFIQGKPYKSRIVEQIVNRPYRVSKVRKP